MDLLYDKNVCTFWVVLLKISLFFIAMYVCACVVSTFIARLLISFFIIYVIFFSFFLILEAEIDRKIVPNISCDEEKDVRKCCWTILS